MNRHTVCDGRNLAPAEKQVFKSSQAIKSEPELHLP